MRLYETTFILSPQADDAAFERQIQAVSDLITRFKGKVREEDRWGIRRMAYAIKKYNQGYYTRIVFEGDQTVLNELERFYRIEEPYIRNLTVCFEGDLNESARPGESMRAETTPTPVEKKPAAEDATKNEPEKNVADHPVTEEATEKPVDEKPKPEISSDEEQL
jgi:small subunit ribosomal protein S6